MLIVACIKVGEKYGRDYAVNLHRAVERHLTVPHEFVCFTDRLVDGVPCKSPPCDEEGWWSKLGLFREGVFRDGDQVLFIDLDTVIVDNFDDVAGYDGEFAILRDWYRPWGLGSCLMSWKAGTCTEIWTKWLEHGRPYLMGGDQAWIEMAHPEVDRYQDLYPNRVVSYKAHCQKGIPDNAAIISFHGLPNPSDCDGWVADHWTGCAEKIAA